MTTNPWLPQSKYEDMCVFGKIPRKQVRNIVYYSCCWGGMGQLRIIVDRLDWVGQDQTG